MRAAATILAMLTLWAAPAALAQDADLHELRWYIHTDMITPSEPLSFWQAFVEQATAQTEVLLKGNQGSDNYPDAHCCTELVAVSVGGFGTPGDGLDAPAASDFALMRARIHGGDPGGSVAFLVTDIALCGGSSSAIGCASTPWCDNDATDDPDLEFMIAVDAMEDGNGDGVPEGVGDMAQTLAHERGHNACLGHVSGNTCNLMASSGAGGCISAAECLDLQQARTTTSQGDACDCHASGGGLESDGAMCTEGATVGFCSGGVCSDGFGGQVELFVAGAPEAVETTSTTPYDEVTDDLLRTSDLPGGWFDDANFPASIQGLAYDADRGVVWGVLDNGADDQIVSIDPATGAINSTLTTLTGDANVMALAFHPGPTAAGSDDHLLAISAPSCELSETHCVSTLIEIDPATGTDSVVDPILTTFVGGMRGLAWDSTNGVLYGTGWAGGSLWRFTDLDCSGASCGCSGTRCDISQETSVSLPRMISGLAYSPVTHRLYFAGTQSGGRMLFNSIDADTFEFTPTIGVDGHTPGGLAAVPLPGPSGSAGLLGALLVAGFAHRRSHVRH